MTRREVIHACPPEGSGLMPCCGRSPYECAGDRIALDAALVTCGMSADPRPCGGQNGNVCVAEGCYGETCKEPTDD